MESTKAEMAIALVDSYHQNGGSLAILLMPKATHF
jgi:hypothetical protein